MKSTTVMLLGATALVLTAALPAQAMTSKDTLLDRIQIEDLIIEYYSQLGGPKGPDFGNEYTEDGELVLGTRVLKGREEIKAMYKGLATPAPGAPKRPRMNVLVSNPRITVAGNTAHGEFIYTGVVVVAPDKAPELHEQGREVDEFVKVNGEWKIKRRQIIGDANAGSGAPPPPPKPAG